MENGRKIKRSMWVAMAACAMIFLCIGGCLVYGLHAAEDYIDANCRRDLGALMEQLERPVYHAAEHVGFSGAGNGALSLFGGRANC